MICFREVSVNIVLLLLVHTSVFVMTYTMSLEVQTTLEYLNIALLLLVQTLYFESFLKSHLGLSQNFSLTKFHLFRRF